MKAKDQIKKTIDEFADSQMNMASDSARGHLAKRIYAELAQRFHITKINELLVKEQQGRDDKWRIEQYNRNREVKDHVSTIEEMEKKVAKTFNMPDEYGVDQGGAYEIVAPPHKIVDDAGVDVKTGKFTG
jgi:hypothetical protein